MQSGCTGVQRSVGGVWTRAVTSTTTTTTHPAYVCSVSLSKAGFVGVAPGTLGRSWPCAVGCTPSVGSQFRQTLCTGMAAYNSGMHSAPHVQPTWKTPARA